MAQGGTRDPHCSNSRILLEVYFGGLQKLTPSMPFHHLTSHPIQPGSQQISWALHTCWPSVQDMCIDHGAVHIAVPQQLLDPADICPLLQQVRGKWWRKYVATGRFADPSRANGFSHTTLNPRWFDVVPSLLVATAILPPLGLGKQPLPAPFLICMRIRTRQRVQPLQLAPACHQVGLMQLPHLAQLPLQRVDHASWQRRAAALIPFRREW